MAHAHDDAGLGARGDLELVGHGRRVDSQRVVAGDGQRRGHALEDAAPVAAVTLTAARVAGAFAVFALPSFALLLFYMIGRSTVRATAFPPAQGIRITRRGYVVRYMLTAVFVIAAIKLPYLNAAAAVIPLFFTKALLLWRHAVQRKGG